PRPAISTRGTPSRCRDARAGSSTAHRGRLRKREQHARQATRRLRMVDIERSIVINAPLEKVWNAIADSTAFGTWFGAEFDEPFQAGRTASARMAPTRMDPGIAAQQEPHAGQPFAIDIVAIEPMRRFAFRWRPSSESEVRTTV